MKKKLLIALGVLVGIVGVFAVVVAMQPSDFRISRSATVDAPPSAVFAQVNDFHKWEAWSPWAKLDPNAKNSFEGPTSGKGSMFKWSGNNEVGEGMMTITESDPYKRILIRLDFKKPMEDTSEAEFRFKPEGDKTVVTWSMFGKHNFVGKAFCLLMNMEKMLGGEFDKGLASMKAMAEKETRTPPEEGAMDAPEEKDSGKDAEK